MSKSIAVLGAGPGLGQAIAHRFAREGYSVALVARRPEHLDQLVTRLSGDGVTAHPIVADLAQADGIPELAERIRATVGDPEVLYYGAAANGFVPVLDLTPQRVHDLMQLGLYSLIELVREFLPTMTARGTGTILSAQGASATYGNPEIAGGVTLAAQRNYLQALHTAVAGQGVFVGGLYIGAAIENTPFYAQWRAAKAAGAPVPDLPTVHPDRLADLLWTMHSSTRQPEISYP